MSALQLRAALGDLLSRLLGITAVGILLSN